MKPCILLILFSLALFSCSRSGSVTDAGTAKQSSDAYAGTTSANEANETDSASSEEGFLRIAWRLQSQENVYGFNVYRAEEEDGSYEIVNDSIIPGHGSTALPKSYDFIDDGLETGKRYYYYVTEVTTTGAESDITPKMGGTAKLRSYYVGKGYLPADP